MSQVGNDVVVVGLGSLDTSALSQVSPTSDFEDSGGVYASKASLVIGSPQSTRVKVYSGTSGPLSFGAGATDIEADAGGGDTVQVFGVNGWIAVPFDYVSGSPLSDTITFQDHSIASLGVTPGVYVWNWGSGPTADSFTLTVAVPEPTCAVMLPAGAAILLRRRALRR